MKLSKIALAAAIACGTFASNAMADQTNDIRLVSCHACDCGEPACGCEAPACCDTDCCDTACDSGCDSCCCDSGCGGMDMIRGSMGCVSDLLGVGNCCLGDPYALFGEHCGYSAGGWLQMGYHNKATSLFNSFPDNYQLQQAWLWAEKAIDTRCGFDIGGRIDYVYGTDAQDTQAFGTDPRGWDNGWDHGPYGHALPQLYVEAGYGDLSVKVGHFFTIIGYEVVAATGNFFYSHAYTMYNSEPFTHTGALATYNASDDLTVYAGYVLGWDSGFDDNGDAFLGGISAQLTCDLNVTYATVAGRFGEDRFNGVETGYMHSIVSQYNLSDSLLYVSQSDYLRTDDVAGAKARDTFGINQYLIKTINDCLAVGARFEWYENEGVYTNVGQEADFYALTLGMNYRPHANVLVRPEVRWDWIDNNAAVVAATGGALENADNDQTTFGIDTILTF